MFSDLQNKPAERNCGMWSKEYYFLNEAENMCLLKEMWSYYDIQYCILVLLCTAETGKWSRAASIKTGLSKIQDLKVSTVEDQS